MIELILMVSLSSVVPGTALAQFQPCMMPNRCAVEMPVLAQFQPCMMPNRCAVESSTTL